MALEIECTMLTLVPFILESIDEIYMFGLDQDHIELW